MNNNINSAGGYMYDVNELRQLSQIDKAKASKIANSQYFDIRPYISLFKGKKIYDKDTGEQYDIYSTTHPFGYALVHRGELYAYFEKSDNDWKVDCVTTLYLTLPIVQELLEGKEVVFTTKVGEKVTEKTIRVE